MDEEPLTARWRLLSASRNDEAAGIRPRLPAASKEVTRGD
jgi:hypothetical protein